MPAPGDQYRATAATTNPFETTTPRINEYTAKELATLSSRLDRQLGPEYISTRPGAGGGKVHYLAAEKAINLANEVFGFNGWSSQIREVQIDFVDESESGKISLGLSIIVRVTLKDGTFHEDIGYGHIENCKGKAAAFEKAKKEAATDAMKRALRTFGNVLGNCLYDKDYLQRITKVKPTPSRWDVENLHRHHDFAPLKKDLAAEVEAMKPVVPLTHGNSILSNGTDFEDEFGGNLFDEMDVSESHTDDIVIHEQTRPPINPGAEQTMSAPPIPPINPQRTANQQQNFQHQQNSNTSNRPNNAPRSQSSNSLVSGANTVTNSRPSVSTTHGGPTNFAKAAVLPQNQAGISGPSSRQSTPHQSTPPPAQNIGAASGVPQDIPTVGFVTGRAAEFLNENGPANASVKIERFNPHAESPSIRKTAGIDHSKSTKIQRDALPTTEDTRPVTNPSLQQLQTPSFPPKAASSFVNPASDAARKIGMPAGGAASPLANRSAYKPPGPAGTGMKRSYTGPAGVEARAPLTDVSNTAASGAVETEAAKRARVSDA